MKTKYKILSLNSARNCFRYIIKAFDIKEIYIPYYICSTIRNLAFKEGCKINYYHIDKNFNPICDFPKEAYILYPNYFGVCSSIVKELATKYKNLIVDNAHSFFNEPCGLTSFNSIRKFFPNIRNGSFLYSTKLLDTDLKKDEFYYENTCLNDAEIIKNEYLTDSTEIMQISDCSFSYFSSLKFEKNRIRKRFDDFSLEFSSINQLDFIIENKDVPYKYPLLINDENILKEVILSLKERDISPLRLWQKMPNDYPESIFYNNLLVI